MKSFLKSAWPWAILWALIILWLSSCTKPDGLEPRMRLYTVKAGKHDFTPSPLPFPASAKTLQGSAKFMPSCWYDNLGEDNADWNKLAGVYRWSDFKKNENAFMLAWRPDTKIKDLFELCLYENIQGRNVPKESAIYKVKSGQVFNFMLAEMNGRYLLYVDNILLGTQANDLRYRTVGKISTWFGGNRTAPHDMHIYLYF
jgi:hypothetical protein